MTWTRLSDRVGRRIRASLLPAALVVVGATPDSAKAQGFGPDPFRPYNSQYDPYVFGVAPGTLDPVGNPTLNRAGVRNANQFQGFLDQIEERDNRYDRANRSYDREYNRLYRPNKEADARFDARRNEVSDVYFRYLREKDPRKRAELFKEYTQAQKGLSRRLSEDPNARGARRPRGDRDAAPPPPSLERRGAARAATPPPPVRPEEDPAAPTDSSERRPARASTPPAPAVEPTPSDILDRALRSGDAPATPAPPPLP